MKHQQHQQELNFLGNFPYHQYPSILDNQKDALENIAKTIKEGVPIVLELPTGSGKTAIGYTFLKTIEKASGGPVFYIVPNKTLVDQMKNLHPDVKIIYGRNEYQCLFYSDHYVSCEESPCSMLDCSHRVDKETGKTGIAGILPCPYLSAKSEIKKGGIIVCTMSFYLFNQLFAQDIAKPKALVIDEAHRIAQVVRNSLSYDITDYHLDKFFEILSGIDTVSASIVHEFQQRMIEIIKYRSSRHASLLEDNEIIELVSILGKIEYDSLQQNIRVAVKKMAIKAIEQRDLLKKMELILRDLSRYFRSLGYSLPNVGRHPLNYTYGYGFYEKDYDKDRKLSYKLCINAYYVGPIIKKIISPFTLAYSATIGDENIFAYETGIKGGFSAFPSDFPAKNAQIFIPTDTPNLAVKNKGHREPTKVLRRIAKSCNAFAKKNIRSLVVVISDQERQKFLTLCGEEGTNAISYGNGCKPREAAEKFKNGEGDVLVGTVANYGEGIDLPKNLAPVIFFLRPGYPRPNDPATLFEERRYGSMRWKIWNWRIMIEALQVRGRNIRSAEDLGVTIFVSQQFRRFVPAVLPEWLRLAYKGSLDFEKCIIESKHFFCEKR